MSASDISLNEMRVLRGLQQHGIRVIDETTSELNMWSFNTEKDGFVLFSIDGDQVGANYMNTQEEVPDMGVWEFISWAVDNTQHLNEVR